MSGLILVGLPAPARTLTQALARLLQLPSESFLTAEAAAGRPGLQVTELRLPGQSGLELLARPRSGAAAAGILLTRHELDLPPALRARIPGLEVVRAHGAYAEPLLKALLAQTHSRVPAAFRSLANALTAGPTELGAFAAAQLPTADPELAALTVDLMAAVLPPTQSIDLWLRTLGPGAASARWAERVLDTVPLLLDGALDVVLALAAAAELEVATRARALALLGRHYDLAAALPTLQAALADPSPRIRLEAAHAQVELAIRAAAVRPEARLESGAPWEALLQIATDDSVDESARSAALAYLAREAAPKAVAALLAQLSAQGPAALRQHAARLLVHADGLDAEVLREVAEDEGQPAEARLQALEQIARALPEALAMPLLERAQPSPEPRVSARAFQLFFSAAEAGFEGSLARAEAGGAPAQRAALLGALEHGRGAEGALLAIAQSGFGTELVAAALRVLGVRFEAKRVGPTLLAALRDPRPLVQAAATLGLRQLGVPGEPFLMQAVLDAALSPEVRRQALAHLVEGAEPERVRRVASPLAQDPEPSLATAAVRAVVIAGAAPLPILLERLVAAGRPELYEGWIEGAVALGKGGYGALSRLVLHPGAAAAARTEGWRALRQGFEAAELAPLLSEAGPEALALDLPPEAPALAGDAGAETQSPVAPTRPPARPVRPRRSTPPPAEASLEEDPEGRAPTRPVPPAALAAEASAPSPPLPSPQVAVVPRRIPSRPSRPAPSHPDALPPIPLGRAQEVLAECVRQGPAGLRGLKLMALSPRVPDSVRASAVRHLVSDFSPAQLGDLLERCLVAPPLVQATALGCLMVQKDPPRGALEALVEDYGAEAATRMRALRFLASRFGRANVAPLLLRALECGEPQLERAALESLFSSVRFTSDQAAESALINLLREHESLEVKTWAAQALGTFGSEAALKHLDHFTGVFAQAEVKEVARRARQRITLRYER